MAKMLKSSEKTGVFCIRPGKIRDQEVAGSNPVTPTRLLVSRCGFFVFTVPAAIKFYTTHLGFALEHDASPAFASVTRDGVRLLLSGKTSSGRRAMPDGREPAPGGWNRIHIQVSDLEAEVKRLREAGLKFRNDIVIGPGGSQILLDDPSGNPVELFQPQKRAEAR